MPFGLTNAPTTFQAAMNELFQPYLQKFVLVFFDDILVYSKTWREHVLHLDQVLTILEEHQFFAKMLKCTFGKEEVDYLGHIISKGVKVNPSKIKAITKWPQLDNISKLRGFLGLTGYYRRYVKNYTHKTTPLTKLLKKNSFRWNYERTKCFEALKNIILSTPVLTTPDFTKPFVVECDASGFEIGAILMQDHPIAFESQKINKREFEIHVWRQYML